MFILNLFILFMDNYCVCDNCYENVDCCCFRIVNNDYKDCFVYWEDNVDDFVKWITYDEISLFTYYTFY